MIIEVPDWAEIGKIVEVRDVTGERTGNKNNWCKEKILSYGLNGVFTQAHNCPVYFSAYENIREIKKDDQL